MGLVVGTSGILVWVFHAVAATARRLGTWCFAQPAPKKRRLFLKQASPSMGAILTKVNGAG